MKVQILGSTRHGSVLFFRAVGDPVARWSTMFAKFFVADPGQTPGGDGLPVFEFSDQDPDKAAKANAWKESRRLAPNPLGFP